jgi:hypothetical protein
VERLYHVSEEPGIEVFAPRPDAAGRAVVWAIGESRLQNYLLPRDCPRVTYYAGEDTSTEDRRRHLGDAASVVAIEEAWRARCRAATLHVYEMDPDEFAVEDKTAAYYTSLRSVKPCGVRRVDDALAALAERDVDVRVLPCLWRLREEIAASTLDFSIIRFRNAGPPPPGFRTRFPVPR